MNAYELKAALAGIQNPSQAMISLYERSGKGDVALDVYGDYFDAKRLIYRDYSRGGMTYAQALAFVREHMSPGISIALYPGDTIVYDGEGRANAEGLAALYARDQKRAAQEDVYKARARVKDLEIEIAELEELLTLIENEPSACDLTLVSYGEMDMPREKRVSIPISGVWNYIATEKSILEVSVGDGVRVSVPHPSEGVEDYSWAKIIGFTSYTDAYNLLNGLKGIGVSVDSFIHLAFCPAPTVLAELIRLRIREKQAHVAGLNVRLEYLREVELILRRFSCSFWMSNDTVQRMYKL